MSLNLYVTFDTKVHFLISDTPLLSFCTTTTKVPLNYSFLGSLQAFNVGLAQGPIFGPLLFSLYSLSLTLWVSTTSYRRLPGQSWPQPLLQVQVNDGTCQPLLGETDSHTVPTERSGAHTILPPGGHFVFHNIPHTPTADSTQVSIYGKATNSLHSTEWKALPN